MPIGLQSKTIRTIHRAKGENERTVFVGQTPLGFNPLETWDKESARDTRGGPALGEVTLGANGAYYRFVQAGEALNEMQRKFVAFDPVSLLAYEIDGGTNAPDGWPVLLVGDIRTRTGGTDANPTYTSDIAKDVYFWGQCTGFGYALTEVDLTAGQAASWLGDRVMLDGSGTNAGVIAGSTTGVDTTESSSRFLANAFVCRPKQDATESPDASEQDSGIGVYLAAQPILTSTAI